MTADLPARLSRRQRWMAFCLRKESGVTLALFRIAIGLVIVHEAITILANDLVSLIWLSVGDGGLWTTAPSDWRFDLVGGVTPTTVNLFLWTLLAAGVCMVIGIGGRIPAVAALLCAGGLFAIDEPGCADDQLIVNALWLLVLARSTTTLAVDCRLRHRRWTSHERVSAWPRYLVIYQLVIVYFATGLAKLGIDWTSAGNFSALYYILQDPSWQRFDMRWLGDVFWISQIATAVTWWFEVTAPLLLIALLAGRSQKPGLIGRVLLALRWRWVFVFAGIGMHATIFALMNVEPFCAITLCYYLCLIRPAEVESESPTSESNITRASVSLFVMLHLIAVSAAAIPVPPVRTFDDAAWADEEAQRELQAWCARLNGFGISCTPDSLIAASRKFATIVRAGRDAIIFPFRPYYKYAGCEQGWYMFSGSEHNVGRLQIAIREDDRWRIIFAQQSSDHTWNREFFRHHRVRPIVFDMSRNDLPHLYEAFARYVARQVRADFPHADRVKIWFQYELIPSPQRAREKRVGESRYEIFINLDRGPS